MDLSLLWNLFYVLTLALGSRSAHFSARRSNSNCQPFHSTFDPSEVSRSNSGDTPFAVVSPKNSVKAGDDGLQLFLDKPSGQIKQKENTNSKVAEGATVNSTFTVLYGKVTFELAGPAVAGIVTAAIMIAEGHDEIDIELVGGDPSHWQTNVFTSDPKDDEPLYGVFGRIEDYSTKASVDEFHEYSIDWNEERIIWGVDGSAVRTLNIEDTRENGVLHYPSHAARIQLGIWDASFPAGTSEWARGPIDWNQAPPRMAAIFKSVSIECPY